MEFDNIAVSSGSVLSSEGLPIKYDLYVPISGTNRNFPVVIFLHGFKGFKDWGPFPDACEELARVGFGVLAMNHSHNGIGNGRTQYERLDLFEQNTLSKDLEDVRVMIDALQSGEVNNSHAHLNTDEIGIVGHSRGGHTAIVAAAEFEAIRCLVTWASVSDYLNRVSDKEKKDWEEKGFTEYKNSRTNQMMKVNRAFYDDLVANADLLIAQRRVKDLRVPSLFIHGREDEAVPHTSSEQLHIGCAAKDKELRFIANTGHTFGAAHPFEEDFFPPQFKELVDSTTSWFREYLR